MNETENQKENFRQRCAVLQDENASEGFTVPMEETATKKRGNKKTRIALVIALSLVLLAVIALGGVSVYYRSAFLPGTVINGYDCSGVSEAGAAEFLLGTAKSHTAQLRDAQGDAVVALPLESFVDTDGFTAALEEYFDAQPCRGRSLRLDDEGRAEPGDGRLRRFGHRRGERAPLPCAL